MYTCSCILCKSGLCSSGSSRNPKIMRLKEDRNAFLSQVTFKQSHQTVRNSLWVFLWSSTVSGTKAPILLHHNVWSPLPRSPCWPEWLLQL